MDNTHNSYQCTEIALCIVSSEVDCITIMKSINCEATEYAEKGSPTEEGSDIPFAPVSEVIIRCPLDEALHPDKHISFFEVLLRSKFAEFSELKKTCQCALFVFIESEADDIGITFSPTFLKLCGDLGVTISVTF